MTYQHHHQVEVVVKLVSHKIEFEIEISIYLLYIQICGCEYLYIVIKRCPKLHLSKHPPTKKHKT